MTIQTVGPCPRVSGFSKFGVEHGMSLSFLMLQVWGPHSENRWFVQRVSESVGGGACPVSWRL